MFIASIALIGLGVTQLKSLQFANNSFDYTISLVQAQNAIERMWPELCEMQHNSPSKFEEPAFRETLQPPQSLAFRYTLELPDDYSNEMPITVSWIDLRVPEEAQNQLLNQITLNASFVEVPNVCNP
jgi:type IV pilus assembly protein PilV